VKLVIAALATALLAVLTFAGPTLADPPSMFTRDAPLHRHFIVQPDGTRVPVGPQICDNPELQQAFNQFHFNIHHSVVPGFGRITTLGPQDGAPGLDNNRGGELLALPGCG
jgi:hypothetical protein